MITIGNHGDICAFYTVLEEYFIQVPIENFYTHTLKADGALLDVIYSQPTLVT